MWMPGDEEPKRRNRGPQLSYDQALDVGEVAEGQQQEHDAVYDGANEARGQHGERKAPLTQWRINPMSASSDSGHGSFTLSHE
jgi:hypothetical protein